MNENDKTKNYVFMQVFVPLTPEKKYDINSILELQNINSFINENCIISLKSMMKNINIYLGKYPIREEGKRFQVLENGEITILFKDEGYS